MAFDISNLADFVDTYGELTEKAITKNHLAGIPGIHEIEIPSAAASINVPFIFSSPAFRIPACGWSLSGASTTLGSKVVSTYGVELLEALCGKALRNKITSVGTKEDAAEKFQSQILAEKTKQLAKTSQNIAVNGNKTSGTGELVFGNGMLYLLDNTYSASTINVTKTAITNTNAVTILDSILSNLTDEMSDMDNIAVMISVNSFRNLMVNLRNLDYKNFPDTANADTMSVALPGYANVTVYSIPTLGNSRAICTFNENIIHGIGIETPLEMFYSRDNIEYRIHAEWYECYDFHFEGLVVRM